MITAIQPLLEQPGDTITLVLARDAKNTYRATFLQRRANTPDEHLPAFTLHADSLEELQASFADGLPSVASARTTALEQIKLAAQTQAAVSSKTGKATAAPASNTAPSAKPGTASKTTPTAPPAPPIANPRIAVIEAELMTLHTKLTNIAKASGLTSAFDGDVVTLALQAMPMGNQYSSLRAELLALKPAAPKPAAPQPPAPKPAPPSPPNALFNPLEPDNAPKPDNLEPDNLELEEETEVETELEEDDTANDNE